MTLSGELFIGGARLRSATVFHAIDAASGEELQPAFFAAESQLVDRACQVADSASAVFRAVDLGLRARFLDAIAERILALGDELLVRAAAESGLPIARLTNERGRTVGQLRLFAEEVRNGQWLGIRIDPALPDRRPLPRPDLRQYKVPLGPVAVFGASNFPLAFSVAGGDTAAALAAGCPVIVKGHPAHPGTSELVAQAIDAAIKECGMPAGVFSLLSGTSHALGAQLVRHPAIKAVAFTGSRTGGLALMKHASERAEPIPVYAEMSSINPVVLLPGALARASAELAKAFVGSVTLGTGQFCTNPGVLFVLDGPDLPAFTAAAARSIEAVAPAAMLTQDIHANYESRVDRFAHHAAVALVARGGESTAAHCGRAALFSVEADAVLEHPEVLEEVFGPSSVIVRCRTEAALLATLDRLEGQLTASVHFTEDDVPTVRSLIAVLERKAGRLIANGWPTGVEVSHAMVHGGPYPATSDGRSTSVGTLAIERFLRPLCYQDFPDTLLPEPLRSDAFAAHPHRLDGTYRSARA